MTVVMMRMMMMMITMYWLYCNLCHVKTALRKAHRDYSINFYPSLMVVRFQLHASVSLGKPLYKASCDSKNIFWTVCRKTNASK